MANTRRFNQRVDALRIARNSNITLRTHNRCQRGPTHGLLGDGHSQRSSSSRSAKTLRHSQITKLKKKGAAAEARILAQNLPEVQRQQLSPHTSSPSYMDLDDPAEDFGDNSHWVDETSKREEEGEDEGDEVEKVVRKMKVEYRDFRTRRERTDTSNKYWSEQQDEMVDAFMAWSLRQENGKPAPTGERDLWIEVIDVFGTEYRAVATGIGKWDSASLIHAGILPTSPLKHSYGFTIRTISLYHKLFVRCPKLGVQPYAKALCDYQGIAFKPYLSSQIYSALDVYISLLKGVRKRTQETLGRSGRVWRMLNACPPCQYRLKEDKDLEIRMIVQMDGNDSLKRVERLEDKLVEREEAGEELPPASREKIDRRIAGEDYFLSRDETDRWNEKNWDSIKLHVPPTVLDNDYIWPEGRCEDRWHNMKEQNTVKSAAKFHENGWFVLLCRHMVVLVVCDMIHSGELSEYPLALLAFYMDQEKDDRLRNGEGSPKGRLGIAYDIACKFSKTVRRSPLAALANWGKMLLVIGALHGYAHERLCQLIFLILYIIGAGIEDAEGSERFFNVSNSLASITRHQSSFHRRQSISEFLYYKDIESYANCSNFIYGNYRQALKILQGKTILKTRMQAAGITPDMFYEWLAEEAEYLRNLTEVPAVETLEMEYFLKLESLHGCQMRLKKARDVFVLYQPGKRDGSNAIEKKHRDEQENERKLIADIQALEARLEIKERWEAGSDDWNRARKLVNEGSYRKALTRLEFLLVARMFEMARLNVSGTGYKMRKHIAQSLKTRSKAIQTAISNYNEAAAALDPPRQPISWDEVVEFSYLSEFDILRDTKEDVRKRRWATPQNRQLMFEFFKIIRAEEELPRLHVEIKRLVTNMRDEERTVLGKATELEVENPALALQLRLYWQERGRYNALHRKRLFAIKKLRGFDHGNSHCFVPGTHVSGVVEEPVPLGEENVRMGNPEGGTDWDKVGDGGDGGDGDDGGDGGDGDHGDDGEEGGEDEPELDVDVTVVLDIAIDREY